MFRTAFALGAITLLGLFGLKLLFGTAVGIFFWLLAMAIKLLVIGIVIYFLVSIFSPDTVRRWRERWDRP